MCKCVKEIQEGLKERGDKDADLINIGFFMGEEKMTWSTTSTVTYIEGQTKSGKDKIKKVPIRHSYCPFCGEKYE